MFIEKQLNIIQTHIENNQLNLVRSRSGNLAVAECLEGFRYGLQTAASLPIAVIKLPISLIYQATGYCEGIHQTVPGFTDLLKSARKTILCFANIIIAPILLLRNPKLNQDYHIWAGLYDLQSYAIYQNQIKMETLASIAGMDELKEALQTHIIKPAKQTNKRDEYQVSHLQGFVFQGPADNNPSKLTFAITTANELGYSFELMPMKYISHQLNTLAKTKTPTVVYLNDLKKELENLDTSKSKAADKGIDLLSTNKKTPLEELVDFIRYKKNKNIIFIAPINHEDLSKAPAEIKELFDKTIEIPYPDLANRQSILSNSLKNLPKDDKFNYEEAAKLCENAPQTTIESYVKRAAKMAFDEDSKITNDLFKKAVQMGSSKAPKKTFKDYAGMEDLKRQVKEKVIAPALNRKQYEKYKVPFPNGVLFYGPPGCGKTLFAECIAGEMGYAFKRVKLTNIESKWIGGSNENLRKIFADAAKESPCVLFIDEIDGLASNRTSDDSTYGKHHNNLMSILLQELDKCQERGVLVIGATNLPNNVDKAITRPGRIDTKIQITAPDQESREAQFRHHVKDRPIDNDFDFEGVATDAEGLTCAEIEYIVNDAAKDACVKNCNISTALVKESLDKFKRSKEELKMQDSPKEHDSLQKLINKLGLK